VVDAGEDLSDTDVEREVSDFFAHRARGDALVDVFGGIPEMQVLFKICKLRIMRSEMLVVVVALAINSPSHLECPIKRHSLLSD
jgi:hypothetical protein